MIGTYIEAIKTLDPTPNNQGFKFVLKNWRNSFDDEGLLEKVAHLDGVAITRSMVIEKFREEDALLAFLYAMIWGFTETGYGAFRTNNYMVEANRLTIFKGINAAKNGKYKEAFKTLYEIKGLGISYVSKILYFAGKATNSADYPLIFDNRVAHSLVAIQSKEIAELLSISPKVKWETYDSYNKMLHRWGNEYKIEADWIELFLFNLKL